MFEVLDGFNFNLLTIPQLMDRHSLGSVSPQQTSNQQPHKAGPSVSAETPSLPRVSVRVIPVPGRLVRCVKAPAFDVFFTAVVLRPRLDLSRDVRV